MTIAWKRTTDAVIEPVTLAEAMEHLNITTDDQSTKLTRDIRAARQQVEDYLHRGLLTQSWTYVLDRFFDVTQLPMAGPLQSVTSVKYYDASGVLQTLATTYYDVDTISDPGRIVLKPNQVWPVLQAGKAGAVVIVYVVGDLTRAAVRADVIDAILLILGDRYEHREATVVGTIASGLPNGVESILAPLRCWWTAPCEEAA